jgi:hypothetical protein
MSSSAQESENNNVKLEVESSAEHDHQSESVESEPHPMIQYNDNIIKQANNASLSRSQTACLLGGSVIAGLVIAVVAYAVIANRSSQVGPSDSILATQTTPALCDIKSGNSKFNPASNPFCKNVRFLEDFTSCDSALSAFEIERCGAAIDLHTGQMDVGLLEECGTSMIKSKEAFTSGYLEATLRIPGSGIAYDGLIYAFYMRSLAGVGKQQDEIDWEWLGSPNKKELVQTNYLVKGVGISRHEGFTYTGPSTYTFLKYGIRFEENKYIEWYINDKLVRRVDSRNRTSIMVGGLPMYVRISFWDASDNKNLLAWAGKANWDAYDIASYKLSFKYIMMCDT